MVSVRGSADRSTLIGDFPNDRRNRRSSLLLPYRHPATGVVRIAPTSVALLTAP